MPHRNVRGPAIIGHESESWTGSDCEAMREVLDKVRSVAPTRATVLLSGETGVGKGVMAKLIHHWSKRKDRPFVAVHCGAIPESLVESELFGHERGSFTGAHRRKQGKFELADGGTLFLDEVGTLPSPVQGKLLEALQERSFHRVGGEHRVDVDVRIVAATNGDLDRMQREGGFRPDLFYRLNVFPIAIPPLRERREDLPRLVSHLLRRLNALYGKQIEGLDATVERAFRSYAWPGNVRELENVVERAHILESERRITARHVPGEIVDAARTDSPVAAIPLGMTGTLASVRSEAISAAERRYLLQLLAVHHGRIDSSARAAGITPRQLRKLLRKHEIRKGDFKTKARGAAARAASAEPESVR
jgi:transcriptional regulator with GAF, ATPase, and Fis domain